MSGISTPGNEEIIAILGELDTPAATGAPTSHKLIAAYLKQVVSQCIVLETLVDDLETRLTAVRAGYLDELAAANIPADVDTLLARLSAARAGYLDNINQAGLLQVTAARATLLDQITAARLAELDAANMPADIDTIKGYLDTEIAAILAAVDTEVAAIKTQTDKLVGSTTQGTASAGTSTPTNIFELTITAKRKMHAVWLDLGNLAANAAITFYYKIDGTNYRVFKVISWTTAQDDGVFFDESLVMEHDFKAEITGGEAEAVDIPYEVHYSEAI